MLIIKFYAEMRSKIQNLNGEEITEKIIIFPFLAWSSSLPARYALSLKSTVRCSTKWQTLYVQTDHPNPSSPAPLKSPPSQAVPMQES